MTMTLLAVMALAAACGLAVMVWTQRRDTRQRAAARVAALEAAIDGETGPTRHDEPLEPALDAFAAERPASEASAPDRLVFAASWESPAPPVRRGWIVVAGAVPLVLAVAALLVARGPRQASAPPESRQPESLELLAMHHDHTGDLLTVTGTVRVRGRDPAPVTAVVTGRDAAGRIVASAHAPLDDAALDLGGESSFQVSVSGGHDVRRYQVRFETPLGPLAHIDSRAATP